MAFYRSAFNPADDRAKHIQAYIASFNDPKLSDKDMYIHARDGTALLSDILDQSYYDRLKKLGELIEKKQTEGMYISKRIQARKIIELQQEYINKAGINGRPGIKAVEPTENGKEREILNAIESGDTEDGNEYSVEL